MVDLTLRGAAKAQNGPKARRTGWRSRVLPAVTTVGATTIAAMLAVPAWRSYMDAPWTRDGTVRAYVATLAPEVSGRVVGLPVTDNQFVHKGDVLVRIDPRDFTAAVERARALVEQASADLDNKRALADRRRQLTDLSTTAEEKGNFDAGERIAQGLLDQRRAELEDAETNLERTSIRTPVDGWVTNLQTRVGDYADKGTRTLSVIDSGSFWVDGYFEETVVAPIREGDPATVKLLGYGTPVRGHVESLARGIKVPNAQSDEAGLANVDPVFTWVRLSQRVPVRVHVDEVPPGVRLVAGMTATVRIRPRNADAPPH